MASLSLTRAFSCYIRYRFSPHGDSAKLFHTEVWSIIDMSHRIVWAKNLIGYRHCHHFGISIIYLHKKKTRRRRWRKACTSAISFFVIWEKRSFSPSYIFDGWLIRHAARNSSGTHDSFSFFFIYVNAYTSINKIRKRKSNPLSYQ